MLNADQKVIPVLTSAAGSCLTAAGWQEVGVGCATYYLDSLLLKPGLTFLKQISNLNTYLGWSGAIILNASNLIANREGMFAVVSPFDGSKTKFSFVELFELIQHLKPFAVLLPKNCFKHLPHFSEHWNEATVPFFATSETGIEQHSSYGVYLDLEAHEADSQLADWSHKLRYVMGDISVEQASELRQMGVDFIETDQPAQLAIAGKVYGDKTIIDLTNDSAAMQFVTLDAQCQCPSCAQQLTRAYLHHLYHHTPLLCERFLLQHNIYQALLLDSSN